MAAAERRMIKYFLRIYLGFAFLGIPKEHEYDFFDCRPGPSWTAKARAAAELKRTGTQSLELITVCLESRRAESRVSCFPFINNLLTRQGFILHREVRL